jgi:ankyrin repeat protein
MITQKKMLQYMTQLGYEINEKGMCFGFSHMTMHAILSKVVDNYNQLLKSLELISEKEEKEGKPLLAAEIERVRQKIRDKQELTLIEEDILNIAAFFDGVAFYAVSRGNYSDISQQNIQHHSIQQAELFFPYVLPKSLVVIEEAKTHKEQRQEKINIARVANFSSIATLEELKRYFILLHKIIVEENYDKDICFILKSTNHTMAVGYNPQKNCWILMNAIEMQAQEFGSDELIASAVMKAFLSAFEVMEVLENKVIAFATDIYIKASEKALPEKFFRVLREWHAIAPEKAQQKDYYGCFPLFIASREGDLETVKQLLNAGANPNEVNTYNLSTPLFIAQLHGKIEIVKYLLEAKADPDQACTTQGITPLILAVEDNNLDIAQYLLAKKANPNKTCVNDNLTPLFTAVSYNQVEMTRLLLSAGANPNAAQPEDAAKPLHIAAQKDHMHVAKMLLENKADPEATFTGSVSAMLKFAEKKQKRNLIEALLKAQNNQVLPEALPGLTALHLAAFFGNAEMVQWLLDNKVNCNTTALELQPRDLALAMGHTQIFEMLNKIQGTASPIKRVITSSSSFFASTEPTEAKKELMTIAPEFIDANQDNQKKSLK